MLVHQSHTDPSACSSSGGASSSFHTPRRKQSQPCTYFDGEVEVVTEIPAANRSPLPNTAIERLSEAKKLLIATPTSISKKAHVSSPRKSIEKKRSPKEDKLTTKVIDMLAEALANHWEDDEDCVTAAVLIQDAMLIKYGSTNPAYRKKARELVFNLRDKKNDRLAGSIVEGAVTPAGLLEMSSSELANEQLRAKMEESKRKQLRNATPINVPIHTMDVKCPHCSKGPAVMRHVNGYDEELVSYLKCTNCSFEYKL